MELLVASFTAEAEAGELVLVDLVTHQTMVMM
jgi:hypothetical protein